MTQETQALGRYGEDVAARHLSRQGMVLLDRNWRCPEGEIDLVLRDGDVLVVAEVKTRRGVGYGHPLEAVDEVRLHRMRRVAAKWMAERRIRPKQVRFDVVGVLRPRFGPARVEHIRGIG